MSTHHAWRPRVDRDVLLNPFAPVTQQRIPTLDHVELVENEEQEGEAPSGADREPGDDKAPAKE
jgi:hypothetical protein